MRFAGLSGDSDPDARIAERVRPCEDDTVAGKFFSAFFIRGEKVGPARDSLPFRKRLPWRRDGRFFGQAGVRGDSRRPTVSDREALPPFATASGKNRLTGACAHSLEKAVGALAATVVWLKGTFHF